LGNSATGEPVEEVPASQAGGGEAVAAAFQAVRNGAVGTHPVRSVRALAKTKLDRILIAASPTTD